MSERKRSILISGTRKGIGRELAEYYVLQGFDVIGCSRNETDMSLDGYRHYCLDVADEMLVKKMFSEIKKDSGHLDILINNAGVASMNHFLLTPLSTVRKILDTNVAGTYLFCQESAKLMKNLQNGRIVNFSTVACPLTLDGEAIYAASKSAVEMLTRILAKEVADMGITVNAVGPTPIRTDLIRNVPKEKIDRLLKKQANRRYGEIRDIVNVVDFFIRPESEFITGQVLYLGGF